MDKKLFPSSFGAEGKITAAQYITEIICNNNYQKVRPNENLPEKFWKQEEWRKFFSWQMLLANNLLETYHIDVILKVIKEERWVSSLTILQNYLPLKLKLKKYNQDKNNEINAEKVKTEKSPIDQLPTIIKNKNKSALSQLRDI